MPFKSSFGMYDGKSQKFSLFLAWRSSYGEESEGSDVILADVIFPAQSRLGSDSNGVEQSDVDWNPSVIYECFPVFCSQQLSAALREAVREIRSDAQNGTQKMQQRSLQMRVLWEIQNSLMDSGGEHPGCPILMMLCMLGYPSLRISKVEDCLQVNSCALPIIPSEEGNSRGNVVVSISEIDAARNEGRDANLEETTLKYPGHEPVCLQIDILEAPQPLHVMFEWDSESEKATVGIGCNSGQSVSRFCWRSWKDGFMGRIYAQLEWRSARLRDPHEELQKKAL